MRNETRNLFNAYLNDIAKLNGIPSATVKFNVQPSVQQKLEKIIQEKAEFLKKINVVPVIDMEGEKIGVGVSGTIASRTDTSAGVLRKARDVHSLTSNKYRCEQINYDTLLRYAMIDLWARDPKFQILLRDAIAERCALDRILIGFNGTKAADTSDRNANPLLQDVQVGWLEHYRKSAPERVMSEGETTGKIIVGASGDYNNLDSLVYDAKSTLIDPVHSQSSDLVALCGSNVLRTKYFALQNQEREASEVLAGKILMSQEMLSDIPAARVYGMPDNTIFITSYKNLSIYYQEGARRRAIKDDPEQDCIKSFESSNDAFVVEDFSAGCLIENIHFAE